LTVLINRRAGWNTRKAVGRVHICRYIYEFI